MATTSNSGHSESDLTRSISPSSTLRISVSSDATVRNLERSISPLSFSDSGHGHEPLKKPFPPIYIHPPSMTIAPSQAVIPTSPSCTSLDLPPPHAPEPPHTAFSEHRWSDIVPPQTALTFAAVFDPSEGLVTFSGASLLKSSSRDPHTRNDSSAAPSLFNVFPSDGQSQVLTIDRLGSVFGRNASGMITPALSTAQLTNATSEGMVDMKSMLEAYFRAGTTLEQQSGYTTPMGGLRPRLWAGGMRGDGESDARASSELEGPLYDRFMKMYNQRGIGGDEDEDDEGFCERKAEDLFNWTWLEKLGNELMLDTRFDSRTVPPKGEDEGDARKEDAPIVDSGYAGEEEYFSERQQAFDSARHAQINRKGTVKREMRGFRSVEDLSEEESYYGPNEKSRFSVTTTSTSNYVDVRLPLSPSINSAWSAVEPPNRASFSAHCAHLHHHLHNLGSSGSPHAPSPNPSSHRKKLQKKKSLAPLPENQPARAEIVLARTGYNHEPTSPIRPLHPNPVYQSLNPEYAALTCIPKSKSSTAMRAGASTPELRYLPQCPRTPPPVPPLPSSAFRPTTPYTQTSPGGKSAKSAPSAQNTGSPTRPKFTAPLCRFTRSQSAPNVTLVGQTQTQDSSGSHPRSSSDSHPALLDSSSRDRDKASPRKGSIGKKSVIDKFSLPGRFRKDSTFSYRHGASSMKESEGWVQVNLKMPPEIPPFLSST